MKSSCSTRTNILDKIKKFLDDEHAIELEKAIYKYSKEYCVNISVDHESHIVAVYKARSYEIIQNFKDGRETILELIKKIQNGHISATSVAYYEPYQLNQQPWVEIRKRNAKIEQTLNNQETIKDKKCKACGGNKHYRTVLQVRSADEPATIFYECADPSCKRTFSINN